MLRVLRKSCRYFQRAEYMGERVGMGMTYGPDGWDSIPGRVKKFSLLHGDQTGYGAHPASYPIGTRVKRPGCDADQSPLSSAEVEWWSYTSTPNTSSWRGAYSWSTATTSPFYLYSVRAGKGAFLTASPSFGWRKLPQSLKVSWASSAKMHVFFHNNLCQACLKCSCFNNL
jgi:hypothetical protein